MPSRSRVSPRSGWRTGRRTYPHTLSGGEAQRVALARALAPDPRLLLPDEPFSSLDPGTRARVRADTLALLRTNGTTAILVTHDPAEAPAFSDRIVLMRAGRILQTGTGKEIYLRPVCLFAARALARSSRSRVTPSTAAAPERVTVCLRARGDPDRAGGRRRARHDAELPPNIGPQSSLTASRVEDVIMGRTKHDAPHRPDDPFRPC